MPNGTISFGAWKIRRLSRALVVVVFLTLQHGAGSSFYYHKSQEPFLRVRAGGRKRKRRGVAEETTGHGRVFEMALLSAK